MADQAPHGPVSVYLDADALANTYRNLAEFAERK